MIFPSPQSALLPPQLYILNILFVYSSMLNTLKRNTPTMVFLWINRLYDEQAYQTKFKLGSRGENERGNLREVKMDGLKEAIIIIIIIIIINCQISYLVAETSFINQDILDLIIEIGKDLSVLLRTAGFYSIDKYWIWLRNSASNRYDECNVNDIIHCTSTQKQLNKVYLIRTAFLDTVNYELKC